MNDWLEKRRQAAHHRRRIIMNNDGDDAFFAREPTPEAFWAERCHGLEGSQVDAIFYSTTASFDLHNHDSKVAELFDRSIPSRRTVSFSCYGELAIWACTKHRHLRRELWGLSTEWIKRGNLNTLRFPRRYPHQDWFMAIHQATSRVKSLI